FMSTKSILVLAMIITSLVTPANSQERYYGVNDQGQKIELTEFKNYYMVHGGCREYNNNTALTEIWLYFSETANITYDPNNPKILRGTMYIGNKYGSIESIAVCSFLRKSLEKQSSVKMDLIPHPYWQNHSLVRSLDINQVYSGLELINSNNLLGNFSAH
ncbi:MAG: hypothetical protein KDD45_11630, partial [Bdellovibrionales bacterium]|nr:hypothetical protein [Bdellovibrionales bacterium]